MPIVNINTIQDKISYSDYITSYTDVYLKQSLANLGQRLSVKGDGITSDSFKVSDVFIDYLQEFTNNDVVRISYNYVDNTVSMQLCNYDENKNTLNVLKNVGSEVPVNYVNNYVEIDEDFQLDIANSIVNNVHHYGSGSVIIKNDEYYVTSAFGYSNEKLDPDSSKDEYKIQEYVCDKIGVDGFLYEGLRILDANIYTETESDKESLIMMHLWYNKGTNSGNTGYVLDIYRPNYDDVGDYGTLKSVKYTINDYLEYNKNKYFTPTTIKNILAPSNAYSDNFYGWSIVKRFQEFSTVLNSNISTYPKTLTYYNEDNQYWKLNDIYGILEIDNKTLVLNDIINYFATDTTTWLDTVKSLYNKSLYLSDYSEDVNINLKKQIFGELIKQLFSDWLSQEATVTENINIYNIYLPIDYTIYYNCNDNDASIIYNSTKNIIVKYTTDILDKIYTIIGDEHSDCILAETSENKVAAYGFTITYLDEELKTGIIDKIEIICQYVLPYINDDGYWCINNEATNIYALGVDSGNPNIILAYSNAFTYSIMSGIGKDVMESWAWEQNKIRIEPLERDNNLGEGFYYELNAYMPASSVVNELPPDQFALISNALFVNFLSPNTESYPEIYKTTYTFDPSKVIYDEDSFTYDSATAEYIKYQSPTIVNTDIIAKSTSKCGGEYLPENLRDKICLGRWYVTAESGDGDWSRNNASISYHKGAYIQHEAWEYTYRYAYEIGMFQRNWLRDREWGYAGDYVNDPENAGSYIDENGDTQYYYDKVWLSESLTYAYYWPLIYDADVSNAYIGEQILNTESLEYKLTGNGVITTFWTLQKNEDLNAYEWAYIKKPQSSFALDTNYINNLDNNIRYYLNHEYRPDNYEHRWVVFEKTNRHLKNNTIDDNSYIYPVVKNKDRDDFIHIFGEALDENIDITSYEIYNNDLNFEIAFYDNVDRNEVGDIPDNGVYQSNDKRYWQGTTYNFHRLDVVSDNDINSNTYGMLVFENVNRAYTGVDSIIKYTKWENEWVPNGQYDPNSDDYSYQYPTLELKEVFLRDVNTINRINVLTFDHHTYTGNPSHLIYNAYFGTSYDTPNKNTLIIGTSTQDINLGTDTMTTYESTHNFTEHNILQLNVDNIESNGYTNLNKDTIANEAIWKKVTTYIPRTGETVSIFSTIVQPCDVAFYLGADTSLIDMQYEEAFTFNNTVDDVSTVYTGVNNSYSVLAYNNYLLSYLNRPRNTQSRYFAHQYEGDNNSENIAINNSYGQTISYLNVTQLLSYYCSIELDCNSYIYGDAQLLWNINTWDQHTQGMTTYENGEKKIYNDNVDDDADLYDMNASRYAYMHSRNTYFLQLHTDLASDENLLFSYSTPRWEVIDGIVSYERENADDLESAYIYDTYRYVITNPIAISYANYSYAREMEYDVERYVYAFTYATSYYMEYTCPGCSLCSSKTCKYIEHCKWSEIVGYFNIGTCWASINKRDYNDFYYYDDAAGNKYAINGQEYIERIYDNLIAYTYKNDNGESVTVDFTDSYILAKTDNKNVKKNIEWSTYDVRKISYTCWTDDENNPRFLKFDHPEAFAFWKETTDTYFPVSDIWYDTEYKTDEDGNIVYDKNTNLPVYLHADAHGNPLGVAYMSTKYYKGGIDQMSYITRYGFAYYTGECYEDVNGVHKHEYTRRVAPEINTAKELGEVFTIANAYYAYIPVTYYDPIRNLKDSYMYIDPHQIPAEYNNLYGSYLWMDAPESYLYMKDGKPQVIYYSTEERLISYNGIMGEVPMLLVATYTPTFGPINNETPNKRGWDITYKTNIYGERLHGSKYVDDYDLNYNGYLDKEDYSKLSYMVDNPYYPGYSKEDLEKLDSMIAYNNEETTYICYFTYLGDFIDTAYAYLSYKCINIRELTTTHTLPYIQNGDLLSTNMTYHAITDQYTYHWNYDNTDSIKITNKKLTNNVIHYTT